MLNRSRVKGSSGLTQYHVAIGFALVAMVIHALLPLARATTVSLSGTDGTGQAVLWLCTAYGMQAMVLKGGEPVPLEDSQDQDVPRCPYCSVQAMGSLVPAHFVLARPPLTGDWLGPAPQERFFSQHSYLSRPPRSPPRSA